MPMTFIKEEEKVGREAARKIFPLIDLKILMAELFSIFPDLKSSVHDYLESKHLNLAKPPYLDALQTDVNGFFNAYDKTLAKQKIEDPLKSVSFESYVGLDFFADEAHRILTRHIIENRHFYTSLPLSSTELEYLADRTLR